MVKISLSWTVKNFQNGCRFVIFAIFSKCKILVFKPYANINNTTGYICAFEWRSNLKIDRVMVILTFDYVLTSWPTYLTFDLTTVIYPCEVLYYICGPRLVMISQKLRPVSLRFWTVTLSFQDEIEGWDSEVTLWRHRPPDQCQKYFFLGNFCWSFRIFGQISLSWNVKNF